MPVKRQPDSGRPDLVLMTFHDLTPLRRVEEMRADFVANASHELRTPLAALSGFHRDVARLGARRCQGARALPRHHAGAGAAHGAADRRSLVAVAHRAQRPSPPGYAGRSGADRSPGGRRSGNVGARPRRHRATSRPRARSTVLGDHDELVRVFENLVENALKYGAPGKRVEITLRPGQSPEGEPRGAGHRARLRAGHRAGARAAIDRALLSRRCHAKAAPRAAPGSGWRWSSTFSTAIAAGCRSKACSAQAPHLPFICPLSRPARLRKSRDLSNTLIVI